MRRSPAHWILVLLLLFAAGCSNNNGTVCKSDNDCPPGRYCRTGGSECAYDCTYNTDCPQGFKCSAHGKCEHGCYPTNGGVEICDGIDNNCDGQTDEGISDRPCSVKNQFGTCTGTEHCQDGSWHCDAPIPAEEICDGIDNNCDGQTDEGVTIRPCPLQQGVCAGAAQVCQGIKGWSLCDYGPDYEDGTEVSCDGKDNNCDGQTDEGLSAQVYTASTPHGNCTNMRDCQGGQWHEAPGGCMVKVPWVGTVPYTYVDAYEATVFDHADCFGNPGNRYGETSYDYPSGWPQDQGSGTVTLYACSLPGLRPSRAVSWYQAQRACFAQHKRLCKKDEWAVACGGPGHSLYCYGVTYNPTICNTFSAGFGDTVPTGSMTNCVSSYGTYDMSGNLWEWAQEDCVDDPSRKDVQGGSYNCWYESTTVHCDMNNPAHQDDIKYRHSCQFTQNGWYCDYPYYADIETGFRCCFDPP